MAAEEQPALSASIFWDMPADRIAARRRPGFQSTLPLRGATDLRTDQITRNVNLGGMTVQINVPNGVSNPQEIAQYVMDEVDRRAWRRVRAYYG